MEFHIEKDKEEPGYYYLHFTELINHDDFWLTLERNDLLKLIKELIRNNKLK